MARYGMTIPLDGVPNDCAEMLFRYDAATGAITVTDGELCGSNVTFLGVIGVSDIRVAVGTSASLDPDLSHPPQDG